MATRIVDKNGNELLVSSTGTIAVTGTLTGGTVGQAAMAASAPVVIASDQSAVPVSGTVTASYTAATSSSTTALAASKVVKGSAGTLYGFNVYNNKSSAQWIQVHNTTSLPADTSIPIISLRVEANSNLGVSYGARGLAFATGITIGNSSSVATLTTGSADCWISAEFV